MKLISKLCCGLCPFILLCVSFGFAPNAMAQQTLGGINGEVTDASGAFVPGADVTVIGDQTKLKRGLKSDSTGAFDFVNLPIGSYSLTFAHAGFETINIPSILVQANRTVTVNATLKVGETSQTVTINETPLVNTVDTTNGYILDEKQLEAIPLPTGSFTGLAILTPGVNAELPAGSGVNAGLGNQPIWANGQRDTSNSFQLNGVDGSNLFNGKSTSQVASARIVNNTGISQTSYVGAVPIQATASPYLAIGEAIPTPAPETLQEFRVNASMYDAQQGSNSGAHIDMSTMSGTNNWHGGAYLHRETSWLNAAPYFYNADPNLTPAEKVPGLHRFTEGGTLGGPIKTNKLFAFLSFQDVHDADQEIGLSRTTVPVELGNNRSAAALADIANDEFGADVDPVVCNNTSCLPTTETAEGLAESDINPIAYALLNYKLPNGQYLIPSANGNTPSTEFPEDALVPGTAYFLARQAVGDIDWNPSASHTVALKYYYQDDPSIAPYGYSSVAGFTQRLAAGSQVFSINNTQMLTPNISVTEIFGFVRERLFTYEDQPFSPQSFAGYVESVVPGISPSMAAINTFGSSFFPSTSIVDALGEASTLPYLAELSLGATAAAQGDLTGIYQNRWQPSSDAIWLHGRHTVTFGATSPTRNSMSETIARKSV